MGGLAFGLVPGKSGWGDAIIPCCWAARVGGGEYPSRELVVFGGCSSPLKMSVIKMSAV